MRGRWSIFDGDGRKVAQFSGREIDADQNIPAGGEKVSGDYDGAVDYFDGTTVVPRPTLSLPSTHSIAVDTDWTVTPVPNGTEVITDGELAGTVADGELVISFPEARVWSLELRPPFPHLNATCEVTVT